MHLYSYCKRISFLQFRLTDTTKTFLHTYLLKESCLLHAISYRSFVFLEAKFLQLKIIHVYSTSYALICRLSVSLPTKVNFCQ